MPEHEEDLLTRTGADTRCGRFLRGFWQPIALSSDLPRDSAPLPVRVFGIDLVLFRKPNGTLGLVARRCAHRGADLCYARIEENGLQCVYHGWTYDTDGTCVNQPNEPAPSNALRAVKLGAHPCKEVGGLIFGYLGEGTAPKFPKYEFLNTREPERVILKVHHACNYLQGLEGNLDQGHISFLHRMAGATMGGTEHGQAAVGSRKTPMELLEQDTAPVIDTEETPFGFRELTRRSVEEGVYFKVQSFAFPGFVAVPGPTQGRGGYLVNWHVPIDDISHWKYQIIFKKGATLDPDTIRKVQIGDSAIRPDGFVDGRLADGRFPQNRASMRQGFFAGLGTGFAFQDLVMCEAQGAIADRSHWHLGSADKSIIWLRKVLKKALKRLDDPQAVEARRSEDLCAEMAVVSAVIPQGEDLQGVMRKHVIETRERISQLPSL